jgi:hypothetical protein
MKMKLKLKQVEALTVSNVNSFVGSICDALVSTAENLQPKRKSNAKRKFKHELLTSFVAAVDLPKNKTSCHQFY